MTLRPLPTSARAAGLPRRKVLGAAVTAVFGAAQPNQKIMSQPPLRGARIAHSQGRKACPGRLGAVVNPRVSNQRLQQDVGRND
ncbi:MAG: hypothetical protein RLY21_2701 [Planctomycetota bacterium]|jgi:hypothetical protein